MRKIKLFAILFCALLCMTGCTRKKVYTIEANQTAFLIPLAGNTAEQASFESEELLNEAKVAAKQIYITSTKRRLGFLNYKYIPDSLLIVVDRSPITREWSNNTDIGTSSNNQAVYAESKESIGFSVGMNCSAQIYTEQDAVKFLYSYNNKSLEDIMDSEIRARIESAFVEKCAEYTMNEILTNKAAIMDFVRNDTATYFADKGITITVLGMKDGVEYDDPKVQTAINAEFVANREKAAQTVMNETEIAKADAEAKASLIKADAQAKANEIISRSLTDKIISNRAIEKWDGNLPAVTSNSIPFVNVAP